MAEIKSEMHSAPDLTKPGRHAGAYLDWAYRIMLGLFALPSLLSMLICIIHFGYGFISVPLACGLLLLPWRILLKSRAMKAVTLAAGCIAAHQLYASSGTFKVLAQSRGLFVIYGVILALGIASLVVYSFQMKHKMWPVVLSAVLVVICFIFGAGNPQWSRLIFIWQVHYSPWRRESVNLPTNRGDVRMILPKYTEWDSLGRKVAEWTHPNGELLRTVYYQNGRKKMERLYAEDQFVTSWYPDGGMEYQYDRQTRRQRAWDPNGTPLEGEVRTTIPGSDGIESVRRYKDGYYDGVHQFRHTGGKRLMREINYRDGLRDGVTREWNNLGVLTGEEYYADGYRHGLRRCFRQDGSLEWEETYDRGIQQGPRKTYPQPKP